MRRRRDSHCKARRSPGLRLEPLEPRLTLHGAEGDHALDAATMTPTAVAAEAVAISGVAIEAATLRAVHDLPGLAGASGTAWQWQADGVPIAEATAEQFTLTAAEVGAVITVTASFTDGQGTTDVVTSPPTVPVASLTSMRDVVTANGSGSTDVEMRAGFLHSDSGVIYVSFDASITAEREGWWLEVLADVDAVIEPEFALVPAGSPRSQLTIYQLSTQFTPSGSAGVYIGSSATIWDDGRVERTSEARLELAQSAFTHSIRFADSLEAGWKSVAYHELGHALALEHPHEDGDGDVDAVIDTNTTIMSYEQVVDADGFPGFTWLDEQALVHIYGAETGTTAVPVEGQLVLDFGPFDLRQTWKTPSLAVSFEDGDVVGEPDSGTVVKRLTLTRYDGYVGSEATVFLDWEFGPELDWALEADRYAASRDVLLSDPYPAQVVFAAGQATASVEITIVGDERVEGDEWLEVTPREVRDPGYFQRFPAGTLRLVIAEVAELPPEQPLVLSLQADGLYVGTTPVLIDGQHAQASIAGWQAVGVEQASGLNHLLVSRGSDARMLADETWAITSLFHAFASARSTKLPRLSRGSSHAVAVTVGGNAYAVVGFEEHNPTLTVYRGTTFSFAVDAVGHPLHLQTAGGGYDPTAAYGTGVSGTGSEQTTILWQIAADAPAELCYQSETDPLVWGRIVVTDLPV